MLTLLFSLKCQESQTHNFCLQHDSFFLSPLPLVQRLNRVSVFTGLCGHVLASCISCHVTLHFWLSCALPFSAALFKPLRLIVRSPLSPFCLPLLARSSPRPLLLSVVVPPPSGACAPGLVSWPPFLWSPPAYSSDRPCSPASLMLLLWSQENRAVWGQFSPTTSARWFLLTLGTSWSLLRLLQMINSSSSPSPPPGVPCLSFLLTQALGNLSASPELITQPRCVFPRSMLGPETRELPALFCSIPLAV